jgi:hypothetical protein
VSISLAPITVRVDWLTDAANSWYLSMALVMVVCAGVGSY